MVIIDRTVWVDYFNGLHSPETDWLDVQLDVQRLGLTTIMHRDRDFDPFEELLGLSVVRP